MSGPERAVHAPAAVYVRIPLQVCSWCAVSSGCCLGADLRIQQYQAAALLVRGTFERARDTTVLEPRPRSIVCRNQGLLLPLAQRKLIAEMLPLSAPFGVGTSRPVDMLDSPTALHIMFTEITWLMILTAVTLGLYD